MKHLILCGGILALALVACAGDVVGQELSDSERLSHGIKLYNNMKYEEAIQVLKEIDPSKLPEFDRNKPALYMKKAQDDLEMQSGAATAIAAGEGALRTKKYVTAIDQFAEAQKLDRLSEADSRRLQSLITVAKQGEKAARQETLAALQEAKAAEADGNKQAAIDGYTRVLAADVYLPAADKQYAEARRAALTGKTTTVPTRVEPAVEPVVRPADEPTPVQPVKPVVETGELRPVVTPSDEQPKPVVVEEPKVVDQPKPVEPVVVVEEPKPAPVDVEAIHRQAVAARAADQVEKGRAAMDTNDLAAARMYFTRALSIQTDNAAARAGLEQVDALLGRGERSLMGQEADRRSVEEQRVVAKVLEAVKEARGAAEVAERPDDCNRALDRLRYANRLINQSNVLTPETAEDLREEVGMLWASIEQSKKDLLSVMEIERDRQISVREQERIRADKEARQRQVESLWTSAQQLAARHEYDTAVTVLDRLLAVNPLHEKARRLKDDYSNLATLTAQIGTRLDRRRETQLALTDTEVSAVPWNEIHRYPPAKVWEELTEKRRRFVAGAAGESEIVKLTRKKLATKGIVTGEDWSIRLDLTATSLGSVLDFIAEAARARPREINIIIDRRGITDAGLSLDDPIDLSVKDVSIEQALKMVLGQDLGFTIQDDGSVLISSRERLNQDLPVTAYFVGDLITQVPDFGDSVPRMTIAEVLSQQGGQGGGGASTLFEDTTITDDAESGTQRLRDLIERTVRSTEPWESMGGRATLDFYERSGLMLVGQTADGHQKLQDLLGQLRRERAIMISIEARFVTVSDAFLNDVTLDFDIAFQHLNDKWGAPGVATNWGADPGVVAASNANVLLPYNTLGGADPIVIGSTSSNNAGTASLRPGLSIFGNLFAGTWGANEGGMVISGVFLDDIQLGFLIRAIQADRRSTLLFAPRLTLWNGQRSWLSDGVHSAYVSDLEPVVAEAAVGWDPEISYLVSGAVLDVKATASADRRYVQLDLRPQVALPPDLTNTTVITAAVPGGVAAATITLPEVQVTHLMTSVSVPDGGTLLIGGIKMFEEHDVEAGVPVLSKVPVLKRLFSNRAQVRGQSNLIILVKPMIIIQAEKEEELGLGVGY